MADTTQDDCRKAFVGSLEKMIEEFDEIDAATPWSEREPEWRVAMQNIRTLAQSSYSRHKSSP